MKKHLDLTNECFPHDTLAEVKICTPGSLKLDRCRSWKSTTRCIRARLWRDHQKQWLPEVVVEDSTNRPTHVMQIAKKET